MLTKSIYALIALLALVSLACGLTINIPVTDVKTGPLETQEISVPFHSADLANLSLAFGAGELTLAPGAENGLVEGMATYNISDLKPDVTIDKQNIHISTGNLDINGIQSFGKKYRNQWDLRLADQPLNLTINAGAYKGDLDLGGLMLKTVRVTDGAADVKLRFSAPNQIEMDSLRYETGASSVKLLELANANFKRLVFKGGAGDYRLDFSGDLMQAADVTIDVGISSVTIIVPQGTPARVFFDGGLSNVDVNGSWEKSGDEYIQPGEGPRLTINVNMGAGNLDLRSR